VYFCKNIFVDIKEFSQSLSSHRIVGGINQWVESSNKNLVIQGFCGSSCALMFASATLSQKNTVYILNDAEQAAYFYQDLLQLLPADEVYYFPSSYKKRVRDGAQKDAANQVLRTEALNDMYHKKRWILVTYPEAIAERVIPPQQLSKETLLLTVGEKTDSDFVISLLTEYGFERVDFVYEPGQFALRGSIIDVFSFSHDVPFRIDFFGDTIDTIRTFDIENQLSIEKKMQISIVSNSVNVEENALVPLFDFFASDVIYVIKNAAFVVELLDKVGEENEESTNFISSIQWLEQWQANKVLEFGTTAFFSSSNLLQVNQGIQPIFHKNFQLLADSMLSFLDQQYEIFVLSDNPKQTERLKDIFEDKNYPITFTPINKTIHEGFVDSDLRICVFTDHQIFDRYHKYSLKSQKTKAGKLVLSLKELMQFQVGDYVVHSEHGVGKFGGLIRTEINGKIQEVIKLLYKDDDIIFVNIHSLHRISKYKSKEGEPPKVNKLGTTAWANLKEKTKKKVKDIARDLISLYAKRKSEKGFSFSPDSYLQNELEASFLYEDTPDQLKTTIALKKDMESDKPMDRLICGDVGFGKTELAIRAAAKAVADSKQVAVLVPTTVLAFQHFNTFKKRLKKFPCTVEYISRARKTADVKAIIEKTKTGAIDILIGTHKLLSKELVFKDLGLLIIDEEQKFGVSTKEKLRQLRTHLDTLTLTATPIPRTLQFSLMGARDLSVISTPPPNRYPVQTELIRFDDDIIREAIEFELARNGQVFFVNNRVSNLPELEMHIKRLVPKARIAVGHGQMDSEKLEGILLDFINHEYDILLATTIIESGIDIPNVNTIFINNAQYFGLSDLHQLRGRVGRTNKKAFCYLISPSLAILPTDARRRLQAIETLADLGSGIHIAMQDLDIRGAGNILGGEQSGFITDLGYETYHRILDEAVSELKHEEFADIFAQEIELKKSYVADCVFESDLELLFPAEYVQNISERMDLYRRLDNIKNEEELQSFEKELVDRFGPLPFVSTELVQVVRLRWLCAALGVEKVQMKNGRLTAFFISNISSPYYQSHIFGAMLLFAQTNPRSTQFRENHGKRSLLISGIDTIQKAYAMFSDIQ
jgi:transcription-repair coupling factor (superfamily II helicase)